MSDVMAGYDEDLFLWSRQQAAALREAATRGVNLPVDWENVAEEIEALGNSDRRAVENRLERLIEHLLKLEASPARNPRDGWERTVVEQRARLRRLLRNNRSLAAQLDAIAAEVRPVAVRKAAIALRRYGEAGDDAALAPRAAAYTVDVLLGEWIPPGPTA